MKQTFCRILLIGALTMVGCTAMPPAPPPGPLPALQRLEENQVPPFFDDMGFDGLAEAIDRSLQYLQKIDPEREFAFGNDRYSAAHMIRSLDAFKAVIETRPSTKAVTEWIKVNCRVYRSTGNDGDDSVLFTGYYEPNLRGSLEPTERYRFPVYAIPEDMLRIDLSSFHPRFSGEQIVARIEDRRVLPYYDREAISYEDRLRGKAEVIAWVDDRVDLFFLHIQGSGRIFLENGQEINVHYHAANGHPYRSIGRLLIEEGKIDRSQMSMQRIRRYLAQHPEEMRRILTYNPSYIFFRVQEQRPVGALGVPLTPGRSLATDRRLFPDAAVAYAATRQPLIDGSGDIVGWTDLNRFMVNQDTGGAISGARRADIYWGNGPYAELAAGHLQHPGRLYFLVLAPESR
jgi:membrane-bound lytic murein transglycosylase A